MSGENYDYSGSYRLGEGSVALASFDATYSIDLFPRQADQPAIVDWLSEPLQGSDVYDEYIEIVRDMAGGAGVWSNGAFEWYAGHWTPLMVKYFMNRFFPSGAGSADVTVMTFDRAYGFRVLWAKMIRPSFRDAEAVGRGYNRIKIEFVNARAAT